MDDKKPRLMAAFFCACGRDWKPKLLETIGPAFQDFIRRLFTFKILNRNHTENYRSQINVKSEEHSIHI